MTTEYTGTGFDAEPDPLKAATGEWLDRPRDTAPRTRYAGDNSDLHALAGETVTVTHYEFTDDGPVEIVEHLPVEFTSFTRMKGNPIHVRGHDNHRNRGAR